MKGKFSGNPLLELYETLGYMIKDYVNNNDNIVTCIDPVAKLILANNGCKFSDDEVIGKAEFILDGDYGIYFISGGIGNDVNECFDFIDINGMSYLVVFLDVFKDFLAKPNSDNEIALNAAVFMGKSNYFDAICKIVNAFIATTTLPAIFTSQLSSSASARKYRFAPSIIASNIIYDICGELNENDVVCADYDMMKDIVENHKIARALHGIFVY